MKTEKEKLGSRMAGVTVVIGGCDFICSFDLMQSIGFVFCFNCIIVVNNASTYNKRRLRLYLAPYRSQLSNRHYLRVYVRVFRQIVTTNRSFSLCNLLALVKRSSAECKDMLCPCFGFLVKHP
jgi:hypothetical protein